MGKENRHPAKLARSGMTVEKTVMDTIAESDHHVKNIVPSQFGTAGYPMNGGIAR